MKLGRPEQFHDKVVLRRISVERAVAQYQLVSAALRLPFESMLTANTSLFLKGFGNDVNLLAVLRELLFPSRELVDVYLGRIATATASTGAQTSRHLVQFLKRLLGGDYDRLQKPIFDFLKLNATYVFHIRKFRNQLKADPSAAEFHFNTNHFEMRMFVPVKEEDESILPYLDITNWDEAMRDRRYMCTVNLDVYFPEMLQFWAALQAVYDESYAVQSGDQPCSQGRKS